MALPSVIRRFELALADSDRDVFEQLDLRVAQHPSESERYLVARVLARALQHTEGLEFSKGGVSDDSEPALIHRDLRGDLRAWIEIGSPSPDRLHKATKASPRVVVYAWKQPKELVAAILERGVHRAEHIELYAFDPDFLDAIAATLDRNNTWGVSVAGGALYVTCGKEPSEKLFESEVRQLQVAG